tara:strand:+ start:778 stop:1338 length:561 start_codon:yes stop_codon:yes gene_type:complete
MDFHFPKKRRMQDVRMDRDKPFSLIDFLSSLLDRVSEFLGKISELKGKDTRLCESCSDLDLYLKPDEVYGQVWDVKKVLENSHLNLAQQKVYLKYGLIDPRVAVERIKGDNTWQDPDYPTLTLEDLNYRPLKLIDAIPTSFYFVLFIILGLMILNDSWFIKFLGISGIGGLFYWLHQKEKAEKEKT